MVFDRTMRGENMADMSNLLTLQTTIFLLMLAGYIMTKLGIIPASARGALSDLVIDFVLPCSIIVSFLLEFNRQIMIACFTVLMVSACIELMTFFVGNYFYSRKNKGRHTVLKYATIVSNAGFLGNPIAQGLYGDIGLLYASIYLIPVRIFMWSAGIACFTGTKGDHMVKKILTHPCILAVMAGLVLMITQLQLPAGIEQTLRTAANCNTALSMIVIGNILAEIHIRDIFQKEVFWYCAVRLLIIPVIVLMGCRLIGLEETVTGVSTVLAGMPAPASAAILASKYHGDEHFAVKIIFLSTILSIATIPGLCVLMQYIR